jgi:hypothetical protein
MQPTLLQRMSLEVALLGRFRQLRYFRFGRERTLVNRMPDECKIGIEVTPKVVLGKPIIRGTSRYRRERDRARHDASSSSNFLASFRSSVSNPSVNQP